MEHSQYTEIRCAPIYPVRIGFVGLGNRGLATLRRYMIIEGVKVTALCDLRPDNLKQADNIMKEHGKEAAMHFTGDNGWRSLCDSSVADIIFICTDWLSHTEIAVKAMRSGKHVAIEVPAAVTVHECVQLVHTSYLTHRHCFMLENCCYDPTSLHTLSMHRQGKLGEITHCEGAYIHDLRDLYSADENHGGYHDNWMPRISATHKGNPYPTHGIGPICKLLDIDHTDRLDYLVSLSAHGKGIPNNTYINDSLIRTVNGISILLQYDVSTPRPYSRLQTVCGTKGFVSKYPVMTVQTDGAEPLTGNAASDCLRSFSHPYLEAYQAEGERIGVPNMMNYIMDRRLIHCLHEGLPLDISVVEAATWSCLTELSALSASQGGMPVKIPDFSSVIPR